MSQRFKRNITRNAKRATVRNAAKKAKAAARCRKREKEMQEYLHEKGWVLGDRGESWCIDIHKGDEIVRVWQTLHKAHKMQLNMDAKFALAKSEKAIEDVKKGPSEELTEALGKLEDQPTPNVPGPAGG
jgi:hypothetical protein